MNEKEKAVLYALSEEPGLFEKVTIKPTLFKGKSRLIFDEISRQFNESQTFSQEEACDKLQMKLSEFHTLFEGCYRFNDTQLALTVRKIEREVLIKKALKVWGKEMESQLATGTVDDEAVEKIRSSFHKVDSLNEVGQFVTDFSSVEARTINWLWYERIPLGMITLIAGHPGVGKSFFTTWLAATLSRGTILPDSNVKIKPCSTLLVSAEDEPGQVIKPRLEGNNADMTKIIAFEDPMRFTLDTMGMLDRELERNPNIRMVVFDPLLAFLGESTNYLKDAEARPKLLALKEIAQDRMVAVLGVVHFNKNEDSELIQRIGGALSFYGVPRSILSVSYDLRETEEDNRDTRLLASLKMNLARKPETLAFKINGSLKIDFNPIPVMISAEALFSRESRERKQHQSITESWLLDYLKANPDSLSKEVIKAAGEEDIPQATLYRAKAKLDNQELTESTETGYGSDNKSYWNLKGKE